MALRRGALPVPSITVAPTNAVVPSPFGAQAAARATSPNDVTAASGLMNTSP